MVGLMLILSSCGNEALIKETTEIQNGNWAFNDARRITCTVDDTLTPYNYQLLVRHGGDYAWQNLIVYFRTYFPNNTYKVDTLNCMLAEPSGKWKGKGLGDLLDNQILFKINEPFPRSGKYIFEIQHAMRPDTIHEIYDIGLLVEKAIN